LPIPLGWTDWQAACNKINSQYKYTINDNGVLRTYGDTEADYQVDVLRDRTLETIDQFADAGDPFMIYTAPTVPHSPLAVAPRYKNAVVQTPELSPAFNEVDVSDKPPWIQSILPLTTGQARIVTNSEVQRMRMLLGVGDMVTAIVQKLEARGVLDNTIIMFTNDNGYMRGEHRIRGGKGMVYEESMNSGPLIVRGPGFASGTVNPAMIGNVDIAPTLQEITGATADIVQDGVSIIPALSDPALFSNRVYVHYVAAGSIKGQPSGDGLRTNRYIYFRFNDLLHTEEMYDHLVDPYEMQNIASDPAYAAVKSSLAGLLTTMKTCKGTACHTTFVDTGPVTTTTPSSTTSTTESTTTVPETTVPDTTVPDTTAPEETTTVP
jgi:hypothetical protein